MEERYLLKSQSNNLFNLIIESGLDRSMFELTNYKSEKVANCMVSKLIHKNTKYYFTFDYVENDNDRNIIYYPNTEGNKVSLSIISWSKIYRHFIEWLGVISEELAISDLWIGITEDKLLLKMPSNKYNEETFSFEEKELIAFTIKELENYIISNFNLIDKDIDYLKNALNILVSESKRQTKKAWIFTAMGVAVSLATWWAKPGEAKKMFQIIISMLSKIFLDTDTASIA